MPTYSDALRGYAFAILKRDGFRCRYCGLDGTASFSNWLALSWDHLLPKGHPKRDDPEFIVAACFFCNVADNRYFDNALKRNLSFDGKSQRELVEQRLPFVERTRREYRAFWEQNVATSGSRPHTENPSEI
jgi:hypothetical protein